MRLVAFHALLALAFVGYEVLALAWGAPPFDPVFPLLLIGSTWRLGGPAYFLSVVFWGLVLDAHSSLVPGPSVLAYLAAIALFWHLRRRLVLDEFYPALLALVATVALAEGLRLYLWPRFFELSLPPLGFYFVGRVLLGTLVWALVSWGARQSFRGRSFLETSGL